MVDYLLEQGAKELFKSFDLETKIIKTNLIVGICLDEKNVYLPKNNSSIYNFISYLERRGYLTKVRQGNYLINWDFVGDVNAL